MRSRGRGTGAGGSDCKFKTNYFQILCRRIEASRTLARMSMFAMETLPRGRRPGSVLGLTLSSKLGTWLYNSVRERIKSFKDSLNLKSSEVCDYAGHAGAWVQQVVLMTQSPLVWTQGPVLGLHSRDRGWCEDPQTQQCLRNILLSHQLTGEFWTGEIPVHEVAILSSWLVPANIMLSIAFYSTSRRESDWCCRARVSRQRGPVRPHSGLKVTFRGHDDKMNLLFQFGTC